MIIGDPYKFAVMFDKVNDWILSDSYDNGHFALCLDGKMIPDHLINAVISTSLYNVLSVLKNIPDNKELFFQGKEQLFSSIYDMAYPSDFEYENDYRYVLSPTVITDESCFVFVVRNNDMIRIIGSSEREYDSYESHHILDNAVITEVTLNKHEIDNIINQIEKTWSDLCVTN